MLRMMQSASSVPNSLRTHHFWLIKTWQGYASAGYIKESRKPVTDQLFKVVKQLRAQHAVARGGSALQIISGARIPIIKVSDVSHSKSAAAAISHQKHRSVFMLTAAVLLLPPHPCSLADIYRFCCLCYYF